MEWFNKRRKILLAGFIGVVLVFVVCRIFFPDDITNFAVAEIGEIEAEVLAMGDIQAVLSTNITIPELMMEDQLRIHHLKITDLVAEGVRVKKGDYIATLDPADVEDRLRRVVEQIENIRNSYEESKLDSALQLSKARAEIVNSRDALVEAEIRKEQSVYESKAVQRQSVISYEREERALQQKIRNYDKTRRRSELKCHRYEERLNEVIEINEQLMQLKNQLRVKSPSNGIVVYAQSYRRRKIKVNDYVGRWAPIIASIPDLSMLVSEAVVKEIDIAKVAKGQLVRLSIDAFPGKQFKGEVKEIANIGQPLSGTGMNGFRVVIEFDSEGESLLPGMSTVNQIVTSHYDDALLVPRSVVFSENSKEFVYVKEVWDIVKREILVGLENETHVQVLKGLDAGGKVLLSPPGNEEECEIVKLE